MPETVYYDVGGVQVTSSRFVVGTQTYPIAQITSVDVVEVHPKTAAAILMLIAGTLCGGLGLCAVANAASSRGEDASMMFVFGILGALTAAGGFAIIKSARTQYAVQIVTASGQQRLVTSTERDVPAAVVAALNQAIVARG